MMKANQAQERTRKVQEAQWKVLLPQALKDIERQIAIAVEAGVYSAIVESDAVLALIEEAYAGYPSDGLDALEEELQEAGYDATIGKHIYVSWLPAEPVVTAEEAYAEACDVKREREEQALALAQQEVNAEIKSAINGGLSTVWFGNRYVKVIGNYYNPIKLQSLIDLSKEGLILLIQGLRAAGYAVEEPHLHGPYVGMLKVSWTPC